MEVRLFEGFVRAVLAVTTRETGSRLLRAGFALRYFINHKSFKINDLLRSIRAVLDPSRLENLNILAEWGAR